MTKSRKKRASPVKPLKLRAPAAASMDPFVSRPGLHEGSLARGAARVAARPGQGVRREAPDTRDGRSAVPKQLSCARHSPPRSTSAPSRLSREAAEHSKGTKTAAEPKTGVPGSPRTEFPLHPPAPDAPRDAAPNEEAMPDQIRPLRGPEMGVSKRNRSSDLNASGDSNSGEAPGDKFKGMGASELNVGHGDVEESDSDGSYNPLSEYTHRDHTYPIANQGGGMGGDPSIPALPQRGKITKGPSVEKLTPPNKKNVF